MPKVDLRIRCKTCGTEDRTFPCPSCFNYTCRECLEGLDEAGCIHRKRDIIQSKTWEPTPEPEPAKHLGNYVLHYNPERKYLTEENFD